MTRLQRSTFRVSSALIAALAILSVVGFRWWTVALVAVCTVSGAVSLILNWRT